MNVMKNGWTDGRKNERRTKWKYEDRKLKKEKNLSWKQKKGRNKNGRKRGNVNKEE